MKRTKETFYKHQPHYSEREGMSGLKEFDGEDLGNFPFIKWQMSNKSLEHDSRKEYYKTAQKNWLEQHQSQKEYEAQREKFEEDLYAKQTLEVTRMR